MPQWDIFHSSRLEVQRGLSTEAVREAIQRGEILDDDLARPAGTSEPWSHLADVPGLLGPATGPDVEAAAPPPPRPPTTGGQELETRSFDEHEAMDSEEFEPMEAFIVDDEDDVDVDEDDEAMDAEIAEEAETPSGALPTVAPGAEAEPLFVEVEDEGLAGEVRILPDEVDPLEEDEAAAEFTLASSPMEKTEEIDLTAMVDVAFQLVLFFLVTATTIYFKALEIPDPSPDDQDSVAQEMRTLDDLLEDYILVEIDSQGRVTVDREPIEPAELVARMRQSREDTLRTAMLLMADFSTPHANAVRAYDAANELGLGIAIAKPTAPAGADDG
ncbi:hypothetical protein BH23PLA1_BH23PLA1_03540 [soil metagenome]